MTTTACRNILEGKHRPKKELHWKKKSGKQFVCKSSALLQGPQLEQRKKKKKQPCPILGSVRDSRKELCINGTPECKEWYYSRGKSSSEDQTLLALTQRDLVLFQKHAARLSMWTSSLHVQRSCVLLRVDGKSLRAPCQKLWFSCSLQSTGKPNGLPVTSHAAGSNRGWPLIASCQMSLY